MNKFIAGFNFFSNKIKVLSFPFLNDGSVLLGKKNLLRNNIFNPSTQKLKFCSMAAGIMVVFVHASSLTSKFYNTDAHWVVNVFIQNFFSNGIARLGLPYFFLLSGSLFFKNYTLDFNCYFRKIRNRLISLAIPYLLWSLYGIILFYVIESYIIPNYDFGRMPIRDYGIGDFFYTLIINPHQRPLWFLRELSMYVLISPLIYLGIKYTKAYLLIVLGGIWLFGIDIQFMSELGLFFFSFGASISLGFIKIKSNSRHLLIVFGGWILLIVIRTEVVFIYQIQNFDLLLKIIYNISRVLGVYVLWFGYDYVYNNKLFKLESVFKVTSYSFFLYLFHKPILDIIKNILLKLMDTSELTLLIVYFLAPILTIAFAIITGQIFKRYIGGFYALITGNR